MLAIVLLLLWQPAILIGELSSQQNIIAVVVDDSRSMGIADTEGKTREAAAVAALEDGVLPGLRKRFQTRVYRLGGMLTQMGDSQSVAQLKPVEALDASWRWPEAAGRGNVGPSARRSCPVERRQ